MDVYAYLLITRLSCQKSVLYLLHLPVFYKTPKELELNDLHSVQAVNLFKHCWILKQKIIASFDNEVFHKIDTIFLLSCG